MSDDVAVGPLSSGGRRSRLLLRPRFSAPGQHRRPPARHREHIAWRVSAMPGVSGRFAQVSGLCFIYDIHATAGSRVTSAVFQNPDGTCSATPVDLTAGSSYTLAENDFMASGGDGYPVDIGSAVTRELLDQVTAAYITANTPISPSIQGRINCTSSGAPLCPTILP